MLTIDNLTIGYDEHVVQTGLCAELRKGELTCLVGTNGVGKSTLLRTLAGFQSALGGQVTLTVEHEGGAETHNLTRLSRQERSRLVSVVLTGRPELQQMTVKEVVGLGRAPYTNMWGSLNDYDHEVVADSMRMVGIDALSHRRIATLSDGECQKVMIAKALAQETPVVILDEPTAFLDYPSKVETMRLLKELAAKGKTILLSTHDLEMAVRSADMLWLMKRDGHLTVGCPQDIVGVNVNEVTTEDLCRIFE